MVKSNLPSKAAWCISFLGIQPTLTQVPPRPKRKKKKRGERNDKNYNIFLVYCLVAIFILHLIMIKHFY